MKIKKSVVKDTWIDYNSSVKFHIRPMPFSSLKGNVFFDLGGANWEIFDFILLGWQGLENEDESAFEFNKENKRWLFDYADDIRNFVLTSSKSIAMNSFGELGN